MEGLVEQKASRPANRKPGRQKKSKAKQEKHGKAFDAVLDKEDREGPIVVTTAGEDGKPPLPLSHIHMTRSWKVLLL